MKISDRIAAARDQLNRTLTFFPRVDGKASVVFAINTSMLALLATRAHPYSQLRWEAVPVSATLILLAISYWFLYCEAFPTLEGGEQSLLYFREVAKRTETNYLAEWSNVTEEKYLEDLVGQVWRNSQILRQKFDDLRIAFTCLALAVGPWLVSLALLSWRLATLSP